MASPAYGRRRTARAVARRRQLPEVEDSPLAAAVALYESARQEIIEKFRLRDQLIQVYFIGLGAFLGFLAVGDRALPEIFEINRNTFVVIPFLSLGFGFILVQHQIQIGLLGKYCDTEIMPIIRRLSGVKDLKDWESSDAIAQSAQSAMRFSWAAYYFIFLSPPLLMLLVQANFITLPASGSMLWRTPVAYIPDLVLNGGVFAAGLTTTLATEWVLSNGEQTRLRLNRDRMAARRAYEATTDRGPGHWPWHRRLFYLAVAGVGLILVLAF